MLRARSNQLQAAPCLANPQSNSDPDPPGFLIYVICFFPRAALFSMHCYILKRTHKLRPKQQPNYKDHPKTKLVLHSLTLRMIAWQTGRKPPFVSPVHNTE